MIDEPFLLFPHTRDGIPPEVDGWLGQRVVQDEVAVAATTLEPSPNVEQAALEILDDMRRRPESRAQVSAEIFILIAWHNKHRIALSPLVLKALASVLGLIRDDGSPKVTEDVLKRFGYPRVRDLEIFLIASRIDGEADAGSEKLSLKELQRRVREALGRNPDPEPEDAGRDKPSRDTLKRYREMEEYQRRRETVAAFAQLARQIYPARKDSLKPFRTKED